MAKKNTTKKKDRTGGSFRDDLILINATRSVVVNDGSEKDKTGYGYAFKTSQVLLENVIAKKEKQRSLFAEMDSDGELAITEASRAYVDRNGKPVYLSTYQMKLVTGLAQVVSTQISKPEISEYIARLPYEIKDRQLITGEGSRPLPNSVEATIDVTAFAKMIYPKGRVGGKQLDAIRKGLIELSEVQQIYKFKDARGGTLTIEAPLINIGKKIKYETKDGIVRFNQITIRFEDVFVYEINEKYSLNPVTLLKLWNEHGLNTEVFGTTLFLLQSVRGRFIKAAQRIVKAKRIELKKEKKDKEEIDKELAALKRSTLTYKESITSISERLANKRYRDKGKYTRFDLIEKDLKQATDRLVKIGIISEYYETIGASGDTICNFVINDKWIADEAQRIKTLAPGKEDKIPFVEE